MYFVGINAGAQVAIILLACGLGVVVMNFLGQVVPWAVRAQWARSLGSRWAPYAPNPVLTQYIVLSHYLNRCSQALFTRFSKL